MTSEVHSVAAFGILLCLISTCYFEISHRFPNNYKKNYIPWSEADRYIHERDIYIQRKIESENRHNQNLYYYAKYWFLGTYPFCIFGKVNQPRQVLYRLVYEAFVNHKEHNICNILMNLLKDVRKKRQPCLRSRAVDQCPTIDGFKKTSASLLCGAIHLIQVTSKPYRCRYVINTPHRLYPMLNFHVFNLEESHKLRTPCLDANRVEIYWSKSLFFKCGYLPSFHIVIPMNSITLRIIMDHPIPGNEVEMTYEAIWQNAHLIFKSETSESSTIFISNEYVPQYPDLSEMLDVGKGRIFSMKRFPVYCKGIIPVYTFTFIGLHAHIINFTLTGVNCGKFSLLSLKDGPFSSENKKNTLFECAYIKYSTNTRIMNTNIFSKTHISSLQANGELFHLSSKTNDFLIKYMISPFPVDLITYHNTSSQDDRTVVSTDEALYEVIHLQHHWPSFRRHYSTRYHLQEKRSYQFKGVVNEFSGFSDKNCVYGGIVFLAHDYISQSYESDYVLGYHKKSNLCFCGSNLKSLFHKDSFFMNFGSGDIEDLAILIYAFPWFAHINFTISTRIVPQTSHHLLLHCPYELSFRESVRAVFTLTHIQQHFNNFCILEIQEPQRPVKMNISFTYQLPSNVKTFKCQSSVSLNIGNLSDIYTIYLNSDSTTRHHISNLTGYYLTTIITHKGACYLKRAQFQIIVDISTDEISLDIPHDMTNIGLNSGSFMLKVPIEQSLKMFTIDMTNTVDSTGNYYHLTCFDSCNERNWGNVRRFLLSM